MDEDYTSDASLVEDNNSNGDDNEDTGTDGTNSVIDLPGDPITAQVEPNTPEEEDHEMEAFTEEGLNEDLSEAADTDVWPLLKDGENLAESFEYFEKSKMKENEKFHGFEDDEIQESLKGKSQILDWEEVKHLLDDFELLPSTSLTVLHSSEKPKTNSGTSVGAGKNVMKRPETSKASTPRLPPKVAKRGSSSLASGGSSPPPLQSPTFSRRESREWRPSGMLFKPLQAGWVREVIFKQDSSGERKAGVAPTILYHAPRFPGIKPRIFKNTGELQSYLTVAEPSLSWHNFSFRQEVMGAAEGQEFVRGENETVDLFPKPPEPLPSKKSKTKKAELKIKGFSKLNEVNSHDDTQKIQPPKTEELTSIPMPTTTATTSKTTAEDNPTNPSSSPPRLTIKPAIPSSSSPPKTVTTTKESTSTTPAVMIPGMTITPVTKKSTAETGNKVTPVTKNVESKRNSSTSSRGASSASRNPLLGKPLLRPTHSNIVTCSIHCPGVSGFPTLSCVSCHSMFHPGCVGLIDGMDYESQYDFYCATCQPPVSLTGKENSNPFSHLPSCFGTPPLLSVGQDKGRSSRGSLNVPGQNTSSSTATSGSTGSIPPLVATQHKLPKGLSIIPKSAVSSNSASGLTNGVSASTKPGKHLAPKSIENQSIVNIAGIKYLIVPHPPSQYFFNNQDKNKKKNNKNSNSNKLPFLLKPSLEAPGEFPSFEVEETSEGKLLLVPVGGSLKNPFANKKSEEKKDSVNSPYVTTTTTSLPSLSNGKLFSSNLSCAYTGMLNVFRYLNLSERMKCAKVCKLWKDLALHPSLWNTAVLKNVKITDWSNFVAFVNGRHSQRIDMRRTVLSNPGQWDEIIESFQDLQHVTMLELPRAPCNVVAKISESCSPFSSSRRKKNSSLRSVVATSISPRELNLEGFENLKGLEELKLKAASGKLKITGTLKELEVLASSLTRISLLSVDSLNSSHLESISLLTNLEQLELGDCSNVPADFFTSITSLPKLTSVRLEKCTVGTDIGLMRWLGKLEKLELIDAQLKEGFGDALAKLQNLEKLLLIPSYTDEVASINAEILDSVMSMPKLCHLFLGLTNEWLESMSSLLFSSNTNTKSSSNSGSKGGHQKDSFPIMVNGVCEMYSLSKLFKTMSSAMPNCRVKILKMSRNSTGKQHIDTLIK